MSRLIATIILLFLLVNVSGLPLRIASVEAGLTIVPDDYSSIQDAINHAGAGDTIYVRNGTYHEHLFLNKTLSLVGESRFGTVIDGDGTCTSVVVVADNVNISNFMIRNGEAGIDISGSGDAIVSNAIVLNGAFETDLAKNLEVSPDPPASPVWRYLYDLINGSYTEFLELEGETAILNVRVSGYSDVAQLTLGLFYDSNMDGIPQLHEFVGVASRDKDTWTPLFDPPPGRYIIKVQGYDVTGNPGHFDRKITKYRGFGIGAHDARNSTIVDNLILGNYAGLYLRHCSGLNVEENNVTGNFGGFVAGDLRDSIFNANNITSNLYGDNFTVGVSLRAAENVNLTDNILAINNFGINLWNSSHVNVVRNELRDHQGWHIGLHASNDCNIAYNNCSNSSALDGIRLVFSSENTLTGNDISNCEHSGILFWYDCHNNAALNNSIQSSGSQGWGHGHGFEVLLSYDNSFSSNHLSHNRNQGIVSIEASGNNFTDNFINSNAKGIALIGSVENRLSHNIIVNNSVQQASDDTGDNLWDDGYYSGGNYWSDYSGADLQSGPYQNDSCSDGLGDTPYAIDSNNLDNFPLMKPYAGPHDLGVEAPELRTVVPEGYSSIVWVNATVLNYGIQAETFNLTLQIGKAIQEQVLSLMERNSTALAFSLNVSGWAKGNYPLSVHASPVPGETDTTDNDYEGVLVVSILGDINGDFTADIYDAIILANAYNSKPGSPNWNPNSDLKADEIIDIYDAIILANHYNQHYP
jgi:parallel beta-helix repeat protein